MQVHTVCTTSRCTWRPIAYINWQINSLMIKLLYILYTPEIKVHVHVYVHVYVTLALGKHVGESGEMDDTIYQTEGEQ